MSYVFRTGFHQELKKADFATFYTLTLSWEAN